MPGVGLWPVSFGGVVTGRVAGPGCAGFGEEPGGVVGVVAERRGDDGRGCLRDELPQCRGAAAQAGDPILA